AVAEGEIGGDMGTMPPAQKRTSLLEFLIDNQLFAEAAEGEKLDKGADYAQLAKENSKDPGSKDDGGNLGYFGHGQMVPQFEDVVFKLKKGEVSEPVKTQFGWHLIKLEDRRMKQPPAFEIVKDRIMQSMLLQKAQKSATELRASAKIEVVDPEIKKSVDDRNAIIMKKSAPTAAPAPNDA